MKKQINKNLSNKICGLMRLRCKVPAVHKNTHIKREKKFVRLKSEQPTHIDTHRHSDKYKIYRMLH